MLSHNKIIPKILPALIICVIGLIIYSNSFQGSFQFDDNSYIANNTTIKYLHNVKEMWVAFGSPARFVGLYTFALNYHFHQLDVVGYHVVNLIIHLINAILVWWFILQILSTPRMESEQIVQYKPIIAFFSALVFLSHPIQTQAVTYISQRMAALATLFYLLSMCLYIKGRRLEGGSKWIFAGAALSAILGMLTKEIVFTLPLAIILFEYIFLKSSFNKKYIAIILLFILIIPVAWSFKIKTIFFTPMASQSHLGDIITSGNYLLTQFRVIPSYIKLLFFPVGQNLDYDFPASQSLLNPPTTLLGLLFIISILFLAIKAKDRHPLAAFGILWFFLTIAVESSIIPIRNVIFEHRCYLPMVGFCLVLSSGIFYYLKDIKKASIILCVIVAIFSFLTFQRNKVWQSGITLWQDVAQKSPNKARPYLNLGVAYSMREEFDLALTNYNQAIEIDPSLSKAYNSRGMVYSTLGKLELARQDFNTAIKLNPEFGEVYTNRAILYMGINQSDLALADFEKALHFYPKHTLAYNNRGALYAKLGQYELALRDYAKALELNPHFVEAYHNRANLYMNLGQDDLALRNYARVLEINDQHANTYNNRGTIFLSSGRLKEALSDFSNTIQFDPQYQDAYFNRGLTYIYGGNPQMALKDFEALRRLNPNNSLAYYGRSLAHQAQGRLKEALDDALKAQSLGAKNIGEYINQLKSEAAVNETIRE